MRKLKLRGFRNPFVLDPSRTAVRHRSGQFTSSRHSAICPLTSVRAPRCSTGSDADRAKKIGRVALLYTRPGQVGLARGCCGSRHDVNRKERSPISGFHSLTPALSRRERVRGEEGATGFPRQEFGFPKSAFASLPGDVPFPQVACSNLEERRTLRRGEASECLAPAC